MLTISAIGTIWLLVQEVRVHSSYSLLAHSLKLLVFAGKLFIDDDEPQTAIRSRYKKLGKFETMYIMADLESEIVLAIIKFRANDGLLLVYPDFNNIDTSPYFREIDSNSKRIYQYSIQNLSNERRQYEWSLKNDMDKLASKVIQICCDACN